MDERGWVERTWWFHRGTRPGNNFHWKDTFLSRLFLLLRAVWKVRSTLVSWMSRRSSSGGCYRNCWPRKIHRLLIGWSTCRCTWCKARGTRLCGRRSDDRQRIPKGCSFREWRLITLRYQKRRRMNFWLVLIFPSVPARDHPKVRSSVLLSVVWQTRWSPCRFCLNCTPWGRYNRKVNRWTGVRWWFKRRGRYLKWCEVLNPSLSLTSVDQINRYDRWVMIVFSSCCCVRRWLKNPATWVVHQLTVKCCWFSQVPQADRPDF